MTALARYDKLECVGRYGETPSDALREVIVSFGEASLTILDGDDDPIAHWPLATLTHVGDGDSALTLAPDPCAGERLHIDDPAMADAVRSVAPNLRASRRTSRRRRLKQGLSVLAVVAMAGGAFLYGPRALETLLSATPASARAALADAAIESLAAGRVCDRPAARRALDRFGARLGLAAGDLVAVDAPAPADAPAVAAPGGRIVVFRATLRSTPDPMALAQSVAAAQAAGAARPPMLAAVAETGVSGLLDVPSGLRPDSELVEAAVRLMREGLPRPDAEAGARRLAELGLPSADPLIAPEAWITLRRACEP